MVSTRFNGTDGVSLEAAKIAEVLEEAGHTVAWFAGERGRRFQPGVTYPLAHFQAPAVQQLQEAWFSGNGLGAATSAAIEERARELAGALRAFITDFDVDVLVIHNALCLPIHLPLGLALGRVLAGTGVPAVGHHHDFYWERERFRRAAAPELLARAFPPALDNLRHVVIHTQAREALQHRRGLPATVLPNVMDFERGPRDPGNPAAYRAAAGLAPGDVLLLQPTRVVPRKNVEATLKLAWALADPRIKVVVSHDEGDEGFSYGRFLRQEAERLGVDLRFVPTAPSAEDADGRPLLADAYAAADLVCYPSRLEGFGNALLEAFFYRRPVLVNRYPAYARDVAPTGVRCLEIENGEPDSEAVKQAAAWLEDPGRWQEAVNTNYEVGREHFSYRLVRERFLPLLPSRVR